MLGRTSGLLLLLLIMLNHAVMACDALVMHLPDHAHAYTDLQHEHCHSDTLFDVSSEQVTAHNVAHNSEHDTDEHSNHAHVTCYIAFFQGMEVLNFRDSVIAATQPGLNLISYRPPVPPPNI